MQHFFSYRLNLLQVQISKRGLKLKLIVTRKIFCMYNKVVHIADIEPVEEDETGSGKYGLIKYHHK